MRDILVGSVDRWISSPTSGRDPDASSNRLAGSGISVSASVAANTAAGAAPPSGRHARRPQTWPTTAAPRLRLADRHQQRWRDVLLSLIEYVRLRDWTMRTTGLDRLAPILGDSTYLSETALCAGVAHAVAPGARWGALSRGIYEQIILGKPRRWPRSPLFLPVFGPAMHDRAHLLAYRSVRVGRTSAQVATISP